MPHEAMASPEVFSGGPDQGRSALDMTDQGTTDSHSPHAESDQSSDAAALVSHNSEINTTAALAHRCGMTHLASGRLCLLPERHAGSCDFVQPSDVESAIAGG